MNTPQQNELAKKKNEHLLNTTRVLLFQGNVPKSYWEEVILIVTYMINKLCSRVLDNTSPVEILNGFYPLLKPQMRSFLRYLGALPLFMTTANIEVNSIPEQSNVSILLTHPLKKD